MLTVMADDTGILHDTLIAPCSRAMYGFLGLDPDHRSCTSNYHEALPERAAADPPQPWNLFMTAQVRTDGAIQYARPPMQPGMSVTLKALTDLVIVVSACPDDHYPTNGGDGSPRPSLLKFRVTHDPIDRQAEGGGITDQRDAGRHSRQSR